MTPSHATGEAGPSSAAEGRRVAARRRFLKMGAGGSTAMVVTIMHKRAFAATTIKKGAIASACVSLQGVPDMKGLHHKKALQYSAQGSPKHVMCRPKPVTNTCLVPAGRESKYRDREGNRFPFFTDGQIKDGCGYLEDTVAASYNNRLYEHGYCPVVFDASGDLTYKYDAIYYEKKDCKQSDLNPAKGIVECLEKVTDPEDLNKKFDLLGRLCEPRPNEP